MIKKSKVVRKNHTWIKLDGNEHIWKYFIEERIIFSISRLAANQHSTVDPGHKDADEICYVISGTVVMKFPNRNRWIELNEGDAILIGQEEPHQIMNTSSNEVIMVWCAAPGVNFGKKPSDEGFLISN